MRPMPLRLFTDDTPWEQARKDVRYTATSLGVRQKHEHLGKPLLALLARWAGIDAQRRAAEDALVDANAAVGALDEELDEAVFRLVSRLLFEVDHNSAHPTFMAYFPEPPSEVIRLGLEGEIARTRELFPVAEERGASADVRAILAVIAALHRRGEEALRVRVEAFLARSRVQLHVQDWKESANAARRSVANVLEGHASKNHLPRGYADGFFPPAARTSKKLSRGTPDLL
jgi:hypothetical protein